MYAKNILKYIANNPTYAKTRISSFRNIVLDTMSFKFRLIAVVRGFAYLIMSSSILAIAGELVG
jgi:hypothetical protein